MGRQSFKWCLHLGLLLMGFAVNMVSTQQSLEEKMKNDPDISQFYSLMEQSKLANFALQFKQVTIFAPINAAFQKIDSVDEDTDSLVLYHMTSVDKRTDQLGTSSISLSSELSGNPPLWITHITGTYHDDIYVNNARILVSQSNIQSSQKDLTQILHKIDEVLVPTRSPKTASNRIYNPTAWEFLNNYESLIQHPHRVRDFRQKVEQHNKQDIFNTEGGHTFFIPVDEGFANDRASLIDDKIIDGHVIPKEVLFTTPTKKDHPFQTLANSDNNIRVLISFTQEQRGNTIINFVKSHTLFEDGKHTPGVVLAEIVKPNIPVKNGVIHLIHKPLMVVDSRVTQLLQEHMDYICSVGNLARERERIIKESKYFKYPENAQYDPYTYTEKDEGILSNFVNAINDMGSEGIQFLKTIERARDVTLFAPCNAALDGDLTLNSILRDKPRFLEILKMHVVLNKRLYVDKIKQDNQLMAQTYNGEKGKNLYFNVLTVGNNRTLTVEGGGVNATVIQADLAATNGIIHIIDRVLGVPYTTVLDKLRTDAMLNLTYTLGNLEGFNNRLNDTTKKFTYFVPRNKAWYDAKVKLPSAIKKLFMYEYKYHATATLERHLVVSDAPYTMERIKQLTNETDAFGRRRELELPTIRGSLKLSIEERQDTFIIIWKGERIPVFRPNVECTNGIIHVIDAPFLKESDIQVSGGSLLKLAPQILTVVIAKILLL